MALPSGERTISPPISPILSRRRPRRATRPQAAGRRPRRFVFPGPPPSSVLPVTRTRDRTRRREHQARPPEKASERSPSYEPIAMHERRTVHCDSPSMQAELGSNGLGREPHALAALSRPRPGWLAENLVVTQLKLDSRSWSRRESVTSRLIREPSHESSALSASSRSQSCDGPG